MATIDVIVVGAGVVGPSTARSWRGEGPRLRARFADARRNQLSCSSGRGDPQFPSAG